MATAVAAPRPRPEMSPRRQPQPRLRIAFVCLGNSCRSQMAEAWARHLSGGEVEAVSAGVHPLGFIAAETIQVMEERQVSLTGQSSKGLEAIDWEQVDVLVNMSPWAAHTLVAGFSGRQVEWHIHDPYGGSLPAYRLVRDELERKVQSLLGELRGCQGGPLAPPVA